MSFLNVVKHNWPLLLLAAACVVIGLLVAHWLGGGERIPVSPPVVVVPDADAVRGRPTEKPSTVVERVARHRVPVVRERSRGTPDREIVERFADAVRRGDRWKRERDSLWRLADSLGQARASVVLPPEPGPLLAPTAGAYDGKRLTLWLSDSRGHVMRATARVRPRFDFLAGHGGTSDTLPQVREDRWWLRQAREGVGCALPTGLSLVAGYVVDDARGAMIGGALAAVACMWD